MNRFCIAPFTKEEHFLFARTTNSRDSVSKARLFSIINCWQSIWLTGESNKEIIILSKCKYLLIVNWYLLNGGSGWRRWESVSIWFRKRNKWRMEVKREEKWMANEKINEWWICHKREERIGYKRKDKKWRLKIRN